MNEDNWAVVELITGTIVAGQLTVATETIPWLKLRIPSLLAPGSAGKLATQYYPFTAVLSVTIVDEAAARLKALAHPLQDSDYYRTEND